MSALNVLELVLVTVRSCAGAIAACFVACPLARREQRNEQSGLDERYLRKMLIGRQEVANDSNMSSDQRKDAELAAYESSMMSYLAQARADGREMEFKQEVKNVKQMRVDEAAKIKAEKKKKSRFR